MPGKTSQAARKYDSSRDRLNSANTSEGSSRRICIWPEWTEAELAVEKWDLGGGGGGGGGKGKDKGKSGHIPMAYEDPDGVLLPPSLADPMTVVWKRPTDEAIAESFNKSPPVIVSNPEGFALDLYSSNKHLFHSQLMCWIVGQLNALWHMRHSLAVDTGGSIEGEKERLLAWRPWEHIQPHPKGTPAPQINLSGKYCVRLYWMGCWRKVTIDDKLPFLEKCASTASVVNLVKDGDSSEEKRVLELIPLYPRTTVLTELWPALLTKAILKVVALDYTEGCIEDEFGDSSVIHMMTGWIPQILPLKPSLSAEETWSTLCNLLPLWKREEDLDELDMVDETDSTYQMAPRHDYIVFGTFGSCYPSPPNKVPSVTALQEVLKSEELLKKFQIIPEDYNLQTQPSYPVLLTQVRDQLLIPPPKEPPLPELQAPYYLGLKKRQKRPGLPTPPPTPPPTEPRFLELYPTVHISVCSKDAVTPEPQGLGLDVSTADAVAKANSDTIGKPLDKPIAATKPAEKPLKSTSDIGPVASRSLHTMPSKTKSARERRKIVGSSCFHLLKVGLKWMDYLEFLSVFTKIYIFKNPHKFKHRESYFELPKTAGTSTRAPTASSSKKGVSSSHLASSSKSTHSKESNFMFVDSPNPIDLIFVFSSLSNWREGGKDTHRCHLSAPINTHMSNRFSHYRPSISVSVVSERPLTPSSTPDTTLPVDGVSKGEESQTAEGGEARRGRNKVLCGSLVVETYCWSSMQFGDPVLQISTTGVKGATFVLPPGRHVFKLHVRVPIGHHLDVLSNTSFVLTNEDAVFSYLSQDCSRLVSCSVDIVSSFLCSCTHIGNLKKLEENLEPLVHKLQEYGLTSGNVKLLLASALYTLSSQAKDLQLTDKMQFAWKAFLIKVCGMIAKQLPQGACVTGSRVFSASSCELTALRKQLSAYSKENQKTEPETKVSEVPENWEDRQPTAEEEAAARIITSHLRLVGKSRLEKSMIPDNPIHQETLEALVQSVPLLESNEEKLGVAMLHNTFKLDKTLAEKFPFYDDMGTQAYAKLYVGSFPAIQPNSWTIVLRQTMHVSEPQLLAFAFSCPLPSSVLRVINNDTMTEIRRVFQTTVPQVYQPNKKGYTLQAEAWVSGVPVFTPSEESEDKKWKLRVVTTNKEKPPVLEDVTTDESPGMVMICDSFHKQELMNYCLPDREEVLFRYLLLPAQETGVSFQVSTSKQDALVQFEILDHDNTVVSVEGRGGCTVPLCFLEGAENTTEHKRSLSPTQPPKHKYVARARVLRKSWPLTDTAWPHIASIRNHEDQGHSGQKPGSGKKTRTAKDKRKTASNTPPGNVQGQPQIDTSKPHWMLRVVTKEEDKVEVKKDTERADHLKSMVQAWEAEQPGRQKESIKSRQKFLESRAIDEKMAADEEDSSSSTATVDPEPAVSTPSLPRPNTGPVKIWQMDVTPFVVKANTTPILLDEAEKARRLEERQKVFKDYRTNRQTVLDLRDEDRQHRNDAKVKQLEMAEKWQMELDALRKKLNSVRESVREKYLAKERSEMERLKALEENQASNASGRDSKMGKGKGGKKKK